jgi:hypothetical protein
MVFSRNPAHRGGFFFGDVMKLVNMPVSKIGAERFEGSSPSVPIGGLMKW